MCYFATLPSNTTCSVDDEASCCWWLWKRTVCPSVVCAPLSSFLLTFWGHFQSFCGKRYQKLGQLKAVCGLIFLVFVFVFLFSFLFPDGSGIHLAADCDCFCCHRQEPEQAAKGMSWWWQPVVRAVGALSAWSWSELSCGHDEMPNFSLGNFY